MTATTDQQILDAIYHLHRTRPYAPTLQEVAHHLGLASRAGILARLRNLRNAGHVDWNPGEPRTLHLTRQPDLQAELDHCRAILADCTAQLSALRQPTASCPGPASPQTAHDPRTSTCPECAPPQG